MFRLLKTKKIQTFESELLRAIKQGGVHSVTDLRGSKFPGSLPVVLGMEILFADSVTDKQFIRIKDYIEREYEFVVDEKSLSEPGKLPKIMLVWYDN